MKFTITLVCWLTAVAAAYCNSLKICVVCQGQISKTIYFKSSPYLQGKQSICESCIKIEQECFTCTLPVKGRFVDLKDGRFLCERDAKTAVLSGETAQALFADVKREVVKMFGGVGRMPDRNVVVRLADARELESLHRVQRFPHNRYATVGLTRTRTQGEEFSHEIYMATGLKPARYMAVAAHEYTHAWMQENVSEDRSLDGDTVEGFCEYVAYRLMMAKSETIEMGLIITNEYTRGQIHAFLAVDPLRFYDVAKWIRTGTDQKFEATALARIAPDPTRGTIPPAWAVANARTQPAAPTSLMLRSVTGSPKRRFALINDQTFAPNDLGKVRLGTSNITIRCLEVTDSAAVVQLVSTGEKRRLELHAR